MICATFGGSPRGAFAPSVRQSRRATEDAEHGVAEHPELRDQRRPGPVRRLPARGLLVDLVRDALDVLILLEEWGAEGDAGAVPRAPADRHAVEDLAIEHLGEPRCRITQGVDRDR